MIFQILFRLVLGSFFLFSGYHKLFNQSRRATLESTFKADKVYSPSLMWAIPLGELFGGAALLLGFLTPLACAGLILICAGACAFDGSKRVKQWQPLDWADLVADYEYLPEVLYIVMLIALALMGAGQFSVDSFLFH